MKTPEEWALKFLNDPYISGNAAKALVDIFKKIQDEARAEEREAAKGLVEAVPDSFIQAFMQSRAWTAAKDINIQSRKDAQERWLEGDWLKLFVPALAAYRAKVGEV
jgi:hypothetical protein